MARSNYSFSRRISDAITMFVVMWLSLLCLIYVAYGEAVRTYERFQGDKLTGQAQIVQNAMETFLRSGLPLDQFVGFNTLADPILASDQTIVGLTVYDPDGRLVFAAGDAELAQRLPAPGAAYGGAVPTTVVRAEANHSLETVSGNYRVVVPLRDKFEKVGSLTVTMPTAAVVDRVWERFSKILDYSPAPAAFFAMLIALFGRGAQRSRLPWPQISFSFIFMASAAVVIATLISLYSEGAQTKARALAESLGQRLSDLVHFNINLNEIEGLDNTFGEYLKVNPDLSSAALTVDNKIIIHTDNSRVGQTWRTDAENYEYVVDLTPDDDIRDVKVAVELPSNVVFGQIIRSVKNFAALFIASAFLANLFFQVGGTVSRNSGAQSQSADADRSWLLDYVKPVFFLGVLSEHLTYAFLPQHVRELAAASGVSDGMATAPFMIFYAMFALTLIPAGYFAQRSSPRPLMYVGLALAGFGMLAMTTTTDFFTLTAARALSGAGQGMLFIGVQSYLLAVSSPRNKTQAAGIIVYGFQGGMISGMAVGSLLVGTMGREGVFALGAVIALVASVYAIGAVPAIARAALSRSKAPSTENLLLGVGKALRNGQFMNAMVSIGLPAKAVLTGVISFALPLLLAGALYAQEDIGQIIMVYAVAVVISSQVIAPRVDRLGDPRLVLFQGAALSGIGLLIVAAAGLYAGPIAQIYGAATATGMLVFGIALVGVAHGFINAPVVTFIAESNLAAQIGAGTATATYRFLERIGHIAGPVIVGQLFLWFADDWTSIACIGGVILLLGLVFLASSSPSEPQEEGWEEGGDDRLAPNGRDSTEMAA